MSRVLNVALHELAAAALPPICAATARRDPADDIQSREVLLFKVEWGWFLTALVLGPILFPLLVIFAPRRRVRLPLTAAVAARIVRTNRRGIVLTRLGYGSFLAVLLPWFPVAVPLLAVIAAGGWLCGLAGAYLLCRQSHDLPALVELFAADRVALELPNWWVADEYRKALGYAPQGQPHSDQSQREEDAVWEARPNFGSWDRASVPVDAPPATPLPPMPAHPPLAAPPASPPTHPAAQPPAAAPPFPPAAPAASPPAPAAPPARAVDDDWDANSSRRL